MKTMISKIVLATAISVAPLMAFAETPKELVTKAFSELFALKDVTPMPAQ